MGCAKKLENWELAELVLATLPHWQQYQGDELNAGG